MNKTLSISAVIPVYNSEKTIKRALDSIINQSQQPTEIILIDDKSTDSSCVIIDNYIKNYKGKVNIKLIKLKKNSGPSIARNIGWNQSTEDYIAFLDSDDSWHKQKLEIQYKYMLMNPDVKLSGHLMKLVLDSGYNEEKKIPDEGIDVQNITSNMMLIKNRFATTSNIMLNRNLSFRFKEYKKYAEDYYLWLEVVFEYKVVLLKHELGYVYKPFTGVSGLSSNIFKMYFGSLENSMSLLKEKHIGIFMYLFLITIRTLRLMKAIMKKYKPF